MNPILLIAFLFLTCTKLTAQFEKSQSQSIADCEGAINVFKSGNYSIQFTGKTGYIDDLLNYPSLSDISSKNIVWLSFIAEADGVLTLDAQINENYLQMIIFQEISSNVCAELSKGTAEIKRIYKSKDQKTVGLDTNVTGGKLYPLSLLAGQKIMIAFTTLEKTKSTVKFDFNFHMEEESLLTDKKQKIIDNRKDDFTPTLTVIARDKETNTPVLGNIIIEGTKELTGLYRCSDLLLNVTRPIKVFIRCDAEGYFFQDKEVRLVANSNQQILFELERIGKGKSFQIEEIEFKPGTSEFMPDSESKLRRLKDFMALNSTTNVEIQGHVFLLGENGFSSQRLSEARAKRVMAFLVDNGINKNRMTAVGYGNSRPIYPEPKFAYEEQANRRVEILVK